MKTKSVKLKVCTNEQAYYDQAILMMKENGITSMNNFLQDEVEQIEQSVLTIPKDRFIEILISARKDYLDIIFSDPMK